MRQQQAAAAARRREGRRPGAVRLRAAVSELAPARMPAAESPREGDAQVRGSRRPLRARRPRPTRPPTPIWHQPRPCSMQGGLAATKAAKEAAPSSAGGSRRRCLWALRRRAWARRCAGMGQPPRRTQPARTLAEESSSPWPRRQRRKAQVRSQAQTKPPWPQQGRLRQQQTWRMLRRRPASASPARLCAEKPLALVRAQCRQLSCSISIGGLSSAPARRARPASARGREQWST